MTTAVRRFIQWNRRVSRWERSLVTRLIPASGRDGPTHFRDRVLPSLLKPGIRVLDVGGGKHPAITVQTKEHLGLWVAGLDISESELVQAPPGAYDAIVVGDVARVNIPGEYDLVFSRTLIEHVDDPGGAIANLAGVLAPGAIMAHVIPCRNAPYAILNRSLGNRAARRLLFTMFPEKEKNSGFPAHYRDCTPSRIVRLCRENGLEVIQSTSYYNSDYTSFFVPLYTLEMLRQVLMCSLRLKNFGEAFSIVAQAPATGPVEARSVPKR